MANYNKRISEFNPNVAQVWVEEPDFSGYKALDFTKIDNIEDILKSGINVNITGASTNFTINSAEVSVSNEVEIKNQIGNPVPISNESIDNLKNNFNNLIFSDSSAPSGLVVYQTNLNKDLDTVTAVISGSVNTNPEKSSNISNFSRGSLNGTVLNANSDRKELYIQNLSLSSLYVKYGADASSGSFNVVLSSNTAVNAGDGGSLNDLSYTGVVSVSGVGSPNYIAWERS